LSETTINDVAKACNVSKRTVSRVINNSSKVNPNTRALVESVIKKLNYVPNVQARGLASSRSFLLGLLYDDPNALVIHAVQRGILSICVDAGYELVVHPCNHNAEDLESSVLNLASRSKLDGLIILPPLSSNDALIAKLQRAGIQYVRLAASPIDALENMVVSRDRDVMPLLAEHFVALGHTEIGVITGPRYRLAAQERLQGFSDGLAALGVKLKASNILEGDFTFESGLACGRRLLKRKRRPTAIFAGNDEMAAGVIHAAEELGLKIPDDLSLAGYDDSHLASRVVPQLTTFRREYEAMAAMAVRKLVANIEGRPEEAASLQVSFSPELLVRKSSGPAR
jgi:LacI family transcriptional regulator